MPLSQAGVVIRLQAVLTLPSMLWSHFHCSSTLPTHWSCALWAHSMIDRFYSYACYQVDRTSVTSCDSTKDNIMVRAKGLGTWPPLAIYPEGKMHTINRIQHLSRPYAVTGTCSNGLVVLQFKLGAFTPGVPVQRQLEYSFLTIIDGRI